MVAILPTMKIIPHGLLLSLRKISAPRSRLSSLRVASPPLTVTLLFSWEKTFVAELIAQVVARILILQYAHQYSITPITHPFVLYDNESAAAAFSKIPMPEGFFRTSNIIFLSSNMPAGAFSYLKNSISEQ